MSNATRSGLARLTASLVVLCTASPAFAQKTDAPTPADAKVRGQSDGGKKAETAPKQTVNVPTPPRPAPRPTTARAPGTSAIAR